MVRKKAKPPLSTVAPSPAAPVVSSPVGSRKPVALQEPRKKQSRLAESAGEAAAECAAVCCCFPCGLANLLMIVAVKLPAGLVRGALRRRKKKAGILWSRARAFVDDEDLGVYHGAYLATDGRDEVWPARSLSTEVSELEKIMWANFYGAGFWRSPSQREKLINSGSISTGKEE